MKIALAVVCLLCSLTACGQDQGKSALPDYFRSAEQGGPFALHQLGITYDVGEGVSQDYAEAVKWYRLAAKQGHAPAQWSLGVAYYRGQGVPQDYLQAHMLPI